MISKRMVCYKFRGKTEVDMLGSGETHLKEMCCRGGDVRPVYEKGERLPDKSL